MAEAYGSAGIFEGGSYGNISIAFSPNGSDGVLLGLEASNWMRGCAWSPTVQQGHGMTFGANRCGKGVTSIIPALLGYAGSMVVTDPKLENAWITANRRRQLGQRVVILDPWNEINERYGSQVGVVEYVTNFNPLANIDPRHPDFADDLASIADALIIPDQHASHHWVEAARNLLVALLATVIEVDSRQASIGLVRKLLNASDKQLIAFMREAMRLVPSNSLAAFKLNRFLDDPKNTSEMASIRSTAETQTQIFDSQRLRDAMTSRPGENFDLAELAQRPTTLYIGLPVDRVQTHGRWLRLILTLAIRAIGRAKRAPRLPVMFLLDEFGTLGPLSAVENAYGLLAGLSVRVWSFLQDLNQLQRDYPHSWGTFFSNASLVQVLTARDVTTSKYFSDYLGTYTHPLHDRNVISRPVLYPEEVRTQIGASDRLYDCDQLVIYPGRGVFRIRQNPYYADPRWRPFYRPIPGRPPYLDVWKPKADYNPSWLRRAVGLAGSPWLRSPQPAELPLEPLRQPPAPPKPPCRHCKGTRLVRVTYGTMWWDINCPHCAENSGAS